MTCVLTLKLRDEHGPRPALQVLLFPETAFPPESPAASENRTGLYAETNGIFEFMRNLLRNGDDARDPYIAPMNTESHAGLPLAILVTNGFDPLRDVGLARRSYADLIHGFPQFTRSPKPAHRATMELADLVREATG